jgi:hypothetical protein
MWSNGDKAKLAKYERQIVGAEGTGIEARWHFGQILLRYREGKQLPNGLLDAVMEEHGLGRSEVQYRMQFAEKFPNEDDVSRAVDTFKSWSRVKSEALPRKAGTKRNDDNENGPLRKTFRSWRSILGQIDPDTLTAADVTELRRVTDAITKLMPQPTSRPRRLQSVR